MVNSKELKIDNLLVEQGEVCKVYKLYKDRFSVWTKRGRRNGILCEPIELTPEILEKCGLKLNKHGRWYISFTREGGEPNEMTLFLGKEEDGFYWWGLQNLIFDTIAAQSIYHLHQLQNLYFALTNQELDVSKLTNK